MDLFLRPTVIADETVPDDFVVIHDDRVVGRIRRATERTPPIWTYSITVPLPVPPDATGGADDLEGAKAAFRDVWERFFATLSPKSVELWHHTADAAAGRFGRTPKTQKSPAPGRSRERGE